MKNQQACEPHLDRLNTYIDLDCYPVHEPDSSAGQALIAQAQQMMASDTLYRTVCPTLSVQINVMDENETFGWHFDTNDGVVSFTIQNADIGGGFEYAPLIRAEDDENYAAVTRILSGADKPHQPRQTPGTLSLFLGRRSLHRSAPVGPTLHKRQSLLFSFDRNPGVVFPEMTCRRLTQGSPEPYLGALTPLT